MITRQDSDYPEAGTNTNRVAERQTDRQEKTTMWQAREPKDKVTYGRQSH
jgi:hypothetical protein